MVSVTESILINRSADEVFAFIGNYENDPKWRAGVSEMRHDPPGEAQVRTKTREVMRFMGQNTVNYAEVVEFDVGHRTAFRTTAGPLTASGYRLVEPEDRQTRFTYHAQAELRGLYRVLSALVVWMLRRRVKKDLQRLKPILETSKQGSVSQPP